MILKPEPERARSVLEEAMRHRLDWDYTTTDWMCAAATALGWLRGYELPPEVLEQYRCTFCGTGGVKLWRAVHSADRAWCARCGTAQAGLPGEIDKDGRLPDAPGPSDQIYSPTQGLNLVPWVPDKNGTAWGYTSVLPEGCEWWRRLPTRPALAEGGGGG